MSWDDETWRLTDPLMPEIDAVETYLGVLPTLPASRGRREGRARSASSQIEVAAELFRALKPDLDPRLHDVVEAYHRHWRDGAEDLSLAEISAMRSRLPDDRPLLEQVLATQFLMGEEPWTTVQNGPVFEIALGLRQGGVPEERVRRALRGLIPIDEG